MSRDVPPEGTLKFLREYHRIEEELMDLLDINTSEPRDLSPMEIRLHKRYAVLREMAMEEDFRAGLRLARLGILVNNLQILRENHLQIFDDFKADFHEVEHDRYFGWRCEVDTAATLTKWGVKFTHPDPPDFQLKRTGEKISIECTSAHYRGSTLNIEKKVKDAVSKKADKSYISPSTALFIDLTNVYHTAVARDDSFNSGDLKEWVRERIQLIDMEIGSVVLLAYMGRLDEFRVDQATDRIDISPNEVLRDFLDEFIPFGEGEKRALWFPTEP